MKQLLIIANPWKNSFSRAMLEAYEKRIKKQDVSYEIIDLYAENNDFLRYENQKELGERELSAYQKKILEAEELVLFFPVWWSSLPAILKNFFDNNFVAGFAYKYNEKWIPEKLLNWKKARVFCTCDWPNWFYAFPGSLISGINLKKNLKNSILGFCGINLEEFHLFGFMRKNAKVSGKLEEILQKIKQN